MNETMWLTGTDPGAMVEVVRRRAMARKLQLLAVACCRQVWPLLDDPRSRAAVDLAERIADGAAGEYECYDVRAEALTAYRVSRLRRRLPASSRGRREADALSALRFAALGTLGRSVDSLAAVIHPTRDAALRTGLAYAGGVEHWQCELLRDIFGNPFRPVAFAPAWRTSTAVALAAQMYESRDFGLMPVLADALDDAGCDSPDVLAHARADAPHVRGCWVVDMILGKE